MPTVRRVDLGDPDLLGGRAGQEDDPGLRGRDALCAILDTVSQAVERVGEIDGAAREMSRLGGESRAMVAAASEAVARTRSTTAEMTDYLKDLERRYPGLEHIILGFPFGASAAEFKDQLERFGRDVMPKFRGR